MNNKLMNELINEVTDFVEIFTSFSEEERKKIKKFIGLILTRAYNRGGIDQLEKILQKK